MFCEVKKLDAAMLARAKVFPRRLHRHNTAQMKATKHGVPWILIHSESFATRREAVQRELYYKTGHGRDDLNTFV
jgi:putative endonuclease